jgi:hypothetical protein
MQLRVGGVDLGQDPPRPRQQQLAGLGHRDPSRRALHERQSGLLLEPPYLLGQGGLGDVLARGRAREVPFLGQRDEVTQLTQFHNDSL